jgi:hypothetical protein
MREESQIKNRVRKHFDVDGKLLAGVTRHLGATTEAEAVRRALLVTDKLLVLQKRRRPVGYRDENGNFVEMLFI